MCSGDVRWLHCCITTGFVGVRCSRVWPVNCYTSELKPSLSSHSSDIVRVYTGTSAWPRGNAICSCSDTISSSNDSRVFDQTATLSRRSQDVAILGLRNNLHVGRCLQLLISKVPSVVSLAFCTSAISTSVKGVRINMVGDVDGICSAEVGDADGVRDSTS